MVTSEYRYKTTKGYIICAIRAKCDLCGSDFRISKRSLKKQQGKTSSDKTYCFRCRCVQVSKQKHQCSSTYWTSQRRQEQSEKVKTSEKHKESRRQLSIRFSGSGNPMFNKKASSETRRKMSISRIGKIGENATAWKGGKFSLVRSIKEHLHRVCNWYFRVYERDGFRCQICGSNKKIEAHHIIPISRIIHKEAKAIGSFSMQEKYEYLIHNPNIIDKDLKNGITLCRRCHSHIHRNWGSHYANVILVEEIKKEYENEKW